MIECAGVLKCNRLHCQTKKNGRFYVVHKRSYFVFKLETKNVLNDGCFFKHIKQFVYITLDYFRSTCSSSASKSNTVATVNRQHNTGNIFSAIAC